MEAVREASDPDYHTLGPEERKYTINKITAYNCLKIYNVFTNFFRGFNIWPPRKRPSFSSTGFL